MLAVTFPHRPLHSLCQLKKYNKFNKLYIRTGGETAPDTVIVTDAGDAIPVSGAVPFEQFQNIIASLL